ncbi:MAG: efflux RND transporter periplasmic adaptor subunit [Flavobacteriales bacterium]|nr:efflux RND transporter periplasmic adaptor subunit [Flavobacteriales bacterium]
MKSVKNNLTFLIIGCLAACSAPKEKETLNVPNEKIQNVEVVHPKSRSFTSQVLISGTAKPNQSVILYAMESGVLMEINKDIGDQVNNGEIIAKLDQPQLFQETSRLQTELKLKKSVYERLSKITQRTPALTTTEDLERAEAQYLIALTKLDENNSRLGFLTIRAPFSGIVTKRFVDKGSLLQNGMNEDNPQSIVEVQQTNPMRITIEVPESDAVSVKKNMPVQLSFPELSGESFDAKISRTSNALDILSKTMQVEIDLDNAEGKIISGMYAKVMIQVNSRENILSLPIISKIRYKNEDYVLVVENQVVKRIPIKIGLSDKEYFEVLNAILDSTTQVIVNGKGLVKQGQTVNPILK